MTCHGSQQPTSSLPFSFHPKRQFCFQRPIINKYPTESCLTFPLLFKNTSPAFNITQLAYPPVSPLTNIQLAYPLISPNYSVKPLTTTTKRAPTFPVPTTHQYLICLPATFTKLSYTYHLPIFNLPTYNSVRYTSNFKRLWPINKNDP